MLRWAGHGFAMGNAVDEVAAATDHQTASNDEDGVARVLERWF
jgi:hydroxymethylpyrimidine pyrophosphatase-like HAD family hydrolase